MEFSGRVTENDPGVEISVGDFPGARPASGKDPGVEITALEALIDTRLPTCAAALEALALKALFGALPKPAVSPKLRRLRPRRRRLWKAPTASWRKRRALRTPTATPTS